MGRRVVVPGVGAGETTTGHFGMANAKGLGEGGTCGDRVLAGGSAGEGEGLERTAVASTAGMGGVGGILPCLWSLRMSWKKS